MLLICPTPIGNLDDISRRQREALAQADIIACEDTRRTGKLLERLGIPREVGRPRLWRYDDHTAQEQAEVLVEQIQGGRQVVLVSDAGTPTISDPGYRLVKACRDAGLEVTALPGPVAAVVALSGSGLASDRFFFEGFLPTGRGQRQERLQELDALGVTVVAYESPRRIVEALEDVVLLCGRQRPVCVARELTKTHEEFLVGSAEEVCESLSGRESVRGEIVLCIGRRRLESEAEIWGQADRAIKLLVEQGLRSRTIKEVVSGLFDVPRSEIYDRINKLTDQN